MSEIISIVIPVYNNEQSIPILWKELVEEFKYFPSIIFEVILINDGSVDQSSLEIRNLEVPFHAKVVLIELTKNFGQLSAIKAGYAHATGEAVITISADLQDPTAIIGKFVTCWLNGSKLVLGVRESRNDGVLRNFTSKIAYKILSLDSDNIPSGGFDIFLAAKEIIAEMNKMPGRFTFLQGDILSVGYPYEIVPYDRKIRIYGKSGYNFRKRLKNFLVAFFDSSYRPIRYLTVFGNIFALIGFSLAVYLVYERFQPDSNFSGLTLLAATVLMIGGIQMLFLSVLAQYIWRIYDLLRKRPSYVISDISRMKEP